MEAVVKLHKRAAESMDSAESLSFLQNRYRFCGIASAESLHKCSEIDYVTLADGSAHTVLDKFDMWSNYHDIFYIIRLFVTAQAAAPGPY